MSNTIWDNFLDESTHEIAGRWVQAGGRKLTTEELYALNDHLENFFSDLRWQPKSPKGGDD